MSYIAKITSPQEKLLIVVRPHWMYIIEGLAWFFGLVAIGFVLDYFAYQFFSQNNIHYTIGQGIYHFDERSYFFPYLMGSIGFAIFIVLFMICVSNEIGLTNERIIHKKGLLFIEVDQVDLSDVRAEQVFHGWLGWLFSYGKIHLDCRFIGDVWLPAIGNPYKIIRGLHIARMRHPNIAYDHQDLELNLTRLAKEEKEKACRCPKTDWRAIKET